MKIAEMDVEYTDKKELIKQILMLLLKAENKEYFEKCWMYFLRL